jgi:hypothetical protein
VLAVVLTGCHGAFTTPKERAVELDPAPRRIELTDAAATPRSPA